LSSSLIDGLRQHASSFILDCSNDSPNSLSPDCMRLRDLFVSKDVLGYGDVHEDCGGPYTSYNPFKRVKRREYIHDSETGLWYRCCEHRPWFGYYSYRTPPPKLQGTVITAGGAIGDMAKAAAKAVAKWASKAFGKAGKLFSKFKKAKGQLGAPVLPPKEPAKPAEMPPDRPPPPAKDYMEQPRGPLLQCNVFENLKLRQDSDGSREATGTGVKRCFGDEAVLLRKFAAGLIQHEKLYHFDPTKPNDGDTTCVDIGPKGTPTVLGKNYSVYTLRAPILPALVGPVRSAGQPQTRPGSSWRGGASDFL